MARHETQRSPSSADPAARHDHVDVGMMCHGRSPCVQHRGDGDLGAEMLGVGGKGKHGLGARLEQEIVDHSFVLVGDIGNRPRHGEDKVEVTGRQQFRCRSANQSLAAAP